MATEQLEAAARVLESPLEQILAAKTAAAMADVLGCTTVGELLTYFPRRYAERGALADIATAAPGETVTLVGYVVGAHSRYMRSRRGKIYEFELSADPDDAGDVITVSFFNNRSLERVTRGTRLLVSGTVSVYREKRSLSHPDFEILSDDDAPDGTVDVRPVPVYPATKKVTSEHVRHSIRKILSAGLPPVLPDPLPEPLRRAESLMTYGEALQAIHAPEEVKDAYRARRRFKYEEAFLLQTVLATRRAAHQAEPATARPGRPDGVRDAFDARLPFELTAGQRETGEVIAAELAATKPMNRLLQGEVGSGKTVVALRALLQVVDSGAQTAFLAPTEVLAEQHFRSINALLGDLAGAGTLGSDPQAIRVELLTGSMPQSAKKKVLLGLASGEVDLVVGTHALLSENVSFAELGMIVVDEQHRFGVEQRDALRQRAATAPHVLIMTATPIPRTVAMTSFGDLAVSSLTELPAGRRPIASHVVALDSHPGWEQRIWERAREEIDAGRQVFVVCPLIDEPAVADPDAPPRASVESTFAYLQSQPHLAATRTAKLHGGMHSEDKEATMLAFAAGEIDLLVATTVIEVGVDVPNATLMIVLDADRFGVAQLHQLRGRIGRGGHDSLCLLVTSLPEGHPSVERLAKVASTTDGLELSEYDVETRKEGDILGAAQSGGASSLSLLRVVHDRDLIARARQAAFELVLRDPQLAGEPVLRQTIAAMDEESKEYLERA
ncbi:ATP-dependent DNA helicase RecG [Zhihengliuella halotolerans]|uniref:ATP-dependent DNA helicase RecG n=1 Tax=Zhihengliuella halotolerans TaxID=370736 RepID=A0A4Q8AD49_9MICC|nr:ATP-dependent DNA helicase RecG [Zhihengliuella halotolerans]RZU61565.1 ATP-dependent DNA helicase RecG [Zhihengliuella halotolerans]